MNKDYSGPAKPRSAKAGAAPYTATSYIMKIKVTLTLPEILAEINKRGWIVSNLFQLGTKTFWRCNVQFIDAANGARFFHEFADGWTAEEAATAALFGIDQDRNKALRGKKSLSQEQILGVPVSHHTGFALSTQDTFLNLQAALDRLIAAFAIFADEDDDI